MADTSQHEELSEPHTNGVMDGLTEEEKSKMRPADIDADMREMERRKRVEMMMNSRLFREELERIIETQMKDGSGPSGLLQQISEMMGAQGARFNANVFKNSNCVVPINDIRGVESMGYAKGEKMLRCKLAAVFRLLDLYGWTQGVGGQITARLNQDQEHFLVNPYGLLYHEVTASSLVKVDMKGTVVEQGTTNFGVHVTGFQLHSTIHAARPDIKCIVHITTPTVTAVSSLKSGLLPLGQESIVIGEVSSHRYMGESVLEPEEREKITRNLGPINKVMLLTNRGALCCGETIEEAFYNVYNTVMACETQLKLMPVGLENLNLISDEAKKAIYEASRKGPVAPAGVAGSSAISATVEPSPLAEKLEKRWRIGGTEFEALMRMLDNAGFRTGYIYRHPLIKGEPPRPRNDVEVPPAVSSLGYLLEEEELYKQGLWKGGRKGTDRSRWLNSPNVYQKIEIQETGTQDPKKITKWVDQNAEEWVSDGSPTHSSTPVKIESALQFVPKNTNPKEFKQLQQQIKDYRRADKISAGPQSHILEGVSWEEAKKMQDATISGTGEQVVLVGAASKGIIQRGFQHNAMVYKTPYAKNPFDAITDQELDQYKKEVERKHKGDPYDESQSESEALSSFNVSRATHESSTAKSPVQSPISVTSETEEESRDEPRVLRIETKQVPVPSQPEMVLSDAQDATSQFLNEMRREAIESRNEYPSHKRDLLASSCSSVYGEETFDGRSVRVLQYDVLRLTIAKCSTVAERMCVVATNDPVASCLASLSHVGCARAASGLKLATTLGLETDAKYPRLVDRADRIIDDRTRLRTSGLKRAFFDDAQFDDVARHGKRKLSEKLADAIARFSSPSDRSKRPRYYETTGILGTSGYVRRIVEKFSNSLFRENKRDSRETTEAKSFSACADKKEVDCRIDRTPRPDFVEQIYLRASSESTDLEKIESEAHQGVGTDEPPTSIVVDPRDVTNGNVVENTTRLPATKDRISLSTVDGDQSDENGNVLTHEARNDKTTCVTHTDDLTSTRNEKNFANPKPKEDKDESVATTIEEIVTVETFDDYEDIDKTDEMLPVSPKKRGFLIRQDSVAQVITSLNGNIMPSQIVMNALPKLAVSTKYNLDSTTAKRYYSLAPELPTEGFPRDASPDDASVMSAPKSPSSIDLRDGISGTASLGDSPTSKRLHEDATTTSESWKNPTSSINEGATMIDWSIGQDEEEWNFEACENEPNEDSDVSGSPLCPMDDLDREDAESFEKDISSSANEIIAHLDIREMFVCAANIVDDVISAVSSLDRIVPSLRAREDDDDDDDENAANYERSILIDAAKKIVTQRLELDSTVDDTRRPDAIDLSIISSDTDADEKRSTRSSGTGSSNSIVVIDEIVHHIVDKFAEKKRGVLHSKRHKETTNVGIVKEMNRTSSRASNEPEPDEILLEFSSPARYNRANNSFELNLRIEHDPTAAKRDESDDTSWKSCESLETSVREHKMVVPVHPSPERPELTTSESTENDTKSDSSKENERSLANEVDNLACRSVPPRFCFIEYDGPEETRDTLSFYEQDYESATRDAPLTCIPEEIMEDIAEELLDEFVQRLDQHCVDRNVASHNEQRCDQIDDDNCNNTYTISDCSDEASSEALYCSTYNADVSSSNDDTRQTSSALENDDAFDTTANYADVSTTMTTIVRDDNTIPAISRQIDLSYEVIAAGQSNIEDTLGTRSKCPDTTDLQILEDRDSRSYESTNEFVTLEQELAIDRERDFCRADVDPIIGEIAFAVPCWSLCTPPLKPLPRYEDTSLYRVVSNINLTDTINSHSEIASEHE